MSEAERVRVITPEWDHPDSEPTLNDTLWLFERAAQNAADDARIEFMRGQTLNGYREEDLAGGCVDDDGYETVLRERADLHAVSLHAGTGAVYFAEGLDALGLWERMLYVHSLMEETTTGDLNMDRVKWFFPYGGIFGKNVTIKIDINNSSEQASAAAGLLEAVVMKYDKRPPEEQAEKPGIEVDWETGEVEIHAEFEDHVEYPDDAIYFKDLLQAAETLNIDREAISYITFLPVEP